MSSGEINDAAAAAKAAVVGVKITGVSFLHDSTELHMGDMVLTAMTKPFGIIGCQGVGPESLGSLVGRVVDDLTVVRGNFLAIDSGENRVAFPIGGDSASRPEVRLVRRART